MYPSPSHHAHQRSLQPEVARQEPAGRLSLGELSSSRHIDPMALKLKELRSDFSALLSLVPGVQECRIDELLGALDPQRIQQVVSPSDDSASPPNWEEVLVLLKTYEEALRINLRQLTTNPSLPLVRAISVILNQFPMAPELALKMSFSIEKQWVTLNALEGSLKGERRPNLIEGSSHPLREQQLTALKRVL